MCCRTLHQQNVLIAQTKAQAGALVDTKFTTRLRDRLGRVTGT